MNRSVKNGPVQYAPRSYKIPCLRLDVSFYEYGVDPYDIFYDILEQKLQSS